MDLWNALLSYSSELFPKEVVEKAIVKSSRVVHFEVIRKAVFQKKLTKKSVKRLQFSQSSRRSQPPKRSGS